MSTHARLSPSSLFRRRVCIGSLALEEGVTVHTTSDYADEGTAAHRVLEWTLESESKYAHAFEGRVLPIINGVYWDGMGAKPPMLKGNLVDIEREFVADDEMCSYVQEVVDHILNDIEAFKATGATHVEMYTERRVDTSWVVNMPGQYGTVDITLVAFFPDGRIVVSIRDFKYGKGVPVAVEDNEQLMTYALGVVREFEVLGTIDEIELVVYQPRLGAPQVVQMQYRDLLAFRDEIVGVAAAAVNLADRYAVGELTDAQLDAYLKPDKDACKFCLAKATCTARINKVVELVADEIIDLDAVEPEQLKTALQNGVERIKRAPTDYLAALYPWLDFIADFPKAVLARIESELLAGREVGTGDAALKLVAGKKGHRKWMDKAEAEEAMKSMRLKADEMYTKEVISPTTAEKLLKKDSPRRWNKLEQLITQSEGKPSIAPISDPKPALVVKQKADDLEVLPEDIA